ncbi:MAG: hypothetical protein QM539_06050 [Alphaproteobacteria bacterium]|nr:hypothetical protein [Alphaproteobacteria bacterium]
MFIIKISVIILLLVFGLQTFNINIVVYDYIKNQKFYASICINKTKPKLQCQGKCQMTKKIQSNDNETNNQKIENSPVDYCSQTFFPNFYFNNETNYNKYYVSYLSTRESKMYFDIFHPPQCI